MIRTSPALTRGVRQMGSMGPTGQVANDAQSQGPAMRPLSDDVTTVAPRSNSMRTGQAFANAARQASIQASALQGPQTQALGNDRAGAAGNFNPLASSQLNTAGVGGQRQAAGLFDDLINQISGSGLDGSQGFLDQLGSLGGSGGGSGYFEDRVAALMINVVEDMQKKIEQRLQKLQSEAQAAEATTAAGGKDTGGESRNIEFEKIKFDMQKLSQIQQAMSNVLNTMDELAKSAIRQIKGG
jgi:hypothetical protein